MGKRAKGEWEEEGRKRFLELIGINSKSERGKGEKKRVPAAEY
jgi:hypothetical protein